MNKGDMMSKENTTGHITQIVGVVVDVEFKDKKLPQMYEALHVEHNGRTITLEVAQHLDERTVRSIALSSTDGL
jgi:F-type H+-transporting ATPase subunit beta